MVIFSCGNENEEMMKIRNMKKMGFLVNMENVKKLEYCRMVKKMSLFENMGIWVFWPN